MKHICSRCKLMSEDGNLWCQEVDCPAGALPSLMRYGDYLGNLKILELKRVLLSSSIYKVERGFGRQTEVLLMKMANPGVENEQYVCHEAEVLRSLSERRGLSHALPRWQPHGATNGSDAFGIAALGEQTRFYYLVDFVEGEFLYDTLLDNPQPWHEHVGWYIMTLCEALQDIQQTTSRLHLNINPDVLLVRRNDAGVLQPVLLDMGLQIAPNPRLNESDLQAIQQHLLPAYTPPSLVTGGAITPRADVYCVGLVLYEMLAGRPAHPYARRRTEDIYQSLLSPPPPVQRIDLPEQPRHGQRLRAIPTPMLQIIRRAIDDHDARAYHDLSELREALFTLYGKVEDRRPFRPKRFFRRAAVFVLAAALIGVLIYVLVVFVAALVQG